MSTLQTCQSATNTAKRIATKRYITMIVMLISLVVVSSFLGFTYRTNALFDTLLLEEARAFSDE